MYMFFLVCIKMKVDIVYFYGNKIMCKVMFIMRSGDYFCLLKVYEYLNS